MTISSNIHRVISVTILPPKVLSGDCRSTHIRDIDIAFKVGDSVETLHLYLFGQEVADGAPIPLNVPEFDALLAGARQVPTKDTDSRIQALTLEKESLRSDFEHTCDELATAHAEIADLKRQLLEYSI